MNPKIVQMIEDKEERIRECDNWCRIAQRAEEASTMDRVRKLRNNEYEGMGYGDE